MASHRHHHPGPTPGEYPVLNLKPGAKWSRGLTQGRLGTFSELSGLSGEAIAAG